MLNKQEVVDWCFLHGIDTPETDPDIIVMHKGATHLAAVWQNKLGKWACVNDDISGGVRVAEKDMIAFVSTVFGV